MFYLPSPFWWVQPWRVLSTRMYLKHPQHQINLTLLLNGVENEHSSCILNIRGEILKLPPFKNSAKFFINQYIYIIFKWIIFLLIYIKNTFHSLYFIHLSIYIILPHSFLISPLQIFDMKLVEQR